MFIQAILRSVVSLNGIWCIGNRTYNNLAAHARNSRESQAVCVLRDENGKLQVEDGEKTDQCQADQEENGEHNYHDCLVSMSLNNLQ